MPRSKGQRNTDYETKRQELIGLARRRLADHDLGHASMREIAAACGVSVPTLRHYFGRRDDVVRNIMAEAHATATPYLARMRTPSGPLETSILDALTGLARGFSAGLGEVFSVGLIEGLRHGALGPSFLEYVLEPSLSATITRLQAHQERGEVRDCDLRVAAIALISPVVIACLHQRELGGSERWPLSMENFIAGHAHGFIRAYASQPAPGADAGACGK